MSARGWSLFLAVSLIWGTPYLMIKLAVDGGLHPAVIVAGRCLIGAVLLLPFAWSRLTALRGRWGWVVVLALIEMTGPFTLLAAAESRLTSSQTGLLIAMVPLVAAVAARLTGTEGRLGPVRIGGLLIGLAGVALLVGLDLGGGDVWSVAAVAGAAAGYAAGPILIARRLADVPPLPLVCAALAVTAVVLAPWAIMVRPTDADPVAWAAVAGLGTFASAIALSLFFALIVEVGPARSTVITYLNTAVAIVLGVTVLGEDLRVGMLVGAPLVVVGSVLATHRSAAARRPALSTDPGATPEPLAPTHAPNH